MEGYLVLVSKGSVGLLDPGIVIVSGLCRMWRTKKVRSQILSGYLRHPLVRR